MKLRWPVLVVLVAALPVMVGCATKKFVREEVVKSEAKVGAEVGRVEGDLGQEKTRIAGLSRDLTETRGVTDEATKRAVEATQRADDALGSAGRATKAAEDAGAKAGQALGQAGDAQKVAGQAQAKAEQTDLRLTRLWANRNQRALGDTVAVRFGFNRAELDDRAQTNLLDIVKQLQENPLLVVDLEGFTDNAGAAPYNIQLSQRRVEAVRRFLVEKGVELHRIQSIGLGDVQPVASNATRQGREQNRRVAVKLFTPVE